MDEYLFILLAKLKSDRLKSKREHELAAPGRQDLSETSRSAARRSLRTRWYASEPPKERAIMRRLITLAASIVVNAGLLSALQLNVYLAQVAPRGEVSITELTEPSSYAQAASAQVASHAPRQAAIITK